MLQDKKQIGSPYSYYQAYENRYPKQVVLHSSWWIILGFRLFATVYLIFGLYYFHWRLTYSLNPEQILFSWLLLIAEAFSFLGSLLIFFNYGMRGEVRSHRAAKKKSDIGALKHNEEGAPITIDVFICTFNEEVGLVQTSVRDAKLLCHPDSKGEIKIFILDDGADSPDQRGRKAIKEMAAEEGVEWMCRENNEGFKAGNLQQGFLKTNGDLLVILDADTRVFPTFLEETMGYFRNPQVAWVQSPQWFYDLTPPVGLGDFIWQGHEKSRHVFKKLLNKIRLGEDVFGNDGTLFYQVILYKRNQVNAAFCCGAGSIHRRSALLLSATKRQTTETPLRPFIFHASEDIYTSLHMHADMEKWVSIQHPVPLCRMLSPQNLDEWVKQRTRYAQGSLDIAIKDNPLWKRGLSLGQRICYFQTIYAYLSPLWIVVFLISPLYFFFTQKSPLIAFSFDFFKLFFVFQMLNIIAVTLGTWGLSTTRSNQYYIASWWVMLRSLVAVVMRKKVRFHVTDKSGKTQAGRLHLFPFWTLLLITLLGWGYNLALILGGTHPTYSGFFSNFLWSFYNLYMCSIFVLAAYWPSTDVTPKNT